MVDEIKFKILDREAERYISVVEMVMLTHDKFSLMPEFLSIFGDDNLLKFIDIFGGCILRVPSRNHIEEMIRDVVIFVEYQKSANKKQALEDMAKRYNLTTKRIKQVVDRIQSMTKFEITEA